MVFLWWPMAKVTAGSSGSLAVIAWHARTHLLLCIGNNWCHDLYFKTRSIFPTFQNSWHTIALRLIGWISPSASLCPVYPVLPSYVLAQKLGLLAQSVPLPFEFLYSLSQLHHSYVRLFDLPHKALFLPRCSPLLFCQWGPLIPLVGDVTFTGSQSVGAGYLFLCDLSITDCMCASMRLYSLSLHAVSLTLIKLPALPVRAMNSNTCVLCGHDHNSGKHSSTYLNWKP